MSHRFRLPFGMHLLALGLGAASLAACQIAGDQSSGLANGNACSEASDCASGLCVDNVCAASDDGGTRVLLEVIPSSGSKLISGVKFLRELELPSSSGSLDIELPHVSHLGGQLKGAEIDAAHCVNVASSSSTESASSEGALPFRVTLVARSRMLGISYPLQTDKTDSTTGDYDVSLTVPPGSYDVYIEPQPLASGCLHSPLLALNQTIKEGDVELGIELPVPEKMSVTVRFPATTDALAGWTLDIVEKEAGRLLSSQAVLGSPSFAQAQAIYQADLAFTPVQGDSDSEVDEIVRLSPPSGLVAPTLYIEKTVVELFSESGSGSIDQLKTLPQSVLGRGQVLLPDGGAATASLSFYASSITSLDAGVTGVFSTSTRTDSNGVFSCELLPGTYTVVVEADSQGVAQKSLTVEVKSNGELVGLAPLKLSPQAQLTGALLSPDGKALALATVVPSAPPASVSSNIFAAALGISSVLPRADVGTSSALGKYSVAVDPGTYELLIRPAASDSLGWMFAGQVQVGSEEVMVGSLQASYPLVLTGSVSAKDTGSLPSALVRAYAYVRDGKLVARRALADHVIAVGEARTGTDASFRLLLPAELSSSSN